MDKKALNEQSQHWEKNFSSKPEMFGDSPSVAAVDALKFFKKQGIGGIIELGAGQGRDTLFFAKNGLKVHALDYSISAINSINKKAQEQKLSEFINTQLIDVRKKLPFKDNTFQGCFSHMLFCMALTISELKELSKEILRILNNKGVNIYTARHTKDGDFKKGIHRGEDLYETNGFIVHFFSKEKIELLSKGYKILDIDTFEEGLFPRKLFRVTLEKI